MFSTPVIEAKKTHEKGENETCEYGTCARMTRNYCCLKKVYSFKVYTSAVCSICLVDNKRVSFGNNEKLQHLFMFDVFRGWRGRSPPYEKITQIITNRGFDSAGFNVRGWRVFFYYNHTTNWQLFAGLIFAADCQKMGKSANK